MLHISILWKTIIIILSELLILLASLDFASIAFLPKGKVQVAAIVAYPITLTRLALNFGLSFTCLVLLLERGDKLMHIGFLLFGFKIIGKYSAILLRPIKRLHGYEKIKQVIKYVLLLWIFRGAMEVVQSDFCIPEINYKIQIRKEDSQMIVPEQLYKYIPKKVERWDEKDVEKWFSVNNFQTSKEFSFQAQKFDGKALIAVSPEYLLSVCGVATRLIMKKIIEWLEYDREEFEEYVDEHPMEEPRVDLNQYISLSKPASTQYVSCSSEDHALQALPTQKNKEVKDKEKAPYRNYFSQAIKHEQSILPIMEVQKWKKKKQLLEEYSFNKKSVSKSNLHRQNSINSNKSESQIPNGANFIQSSYEIRHTLLQFTFDNQVILLQNSGKLGRQIDNDVINTSQSVSRKHAEIIKKGNDFFIKDIGSRFGTFIEIGKPYRNCLEQGDIIVFEDYQIEIMNFTYKSKQNTYDLKIKKDYEEEDNKFETFLNKRVVTIGRKQGKDIMLPDEKIKSKHASIIVDPYGKLMIKAQDGICFKKLKKDELVRIEEQDHILRLGLTEAKIKIIHNIKPVPNVSDFAPERS